VSGPPSACTAIWNGSVSPRAALIAIAGRSWGAARRVSRCMPSRAQARGVPLPEAASDSAVGPGAGASGRAAVVGPSGRSAKAVAAAARAEVSRSDMAVPLGHGRRCVVGAPG